MADEPSPCTPAQEEALRLLAQGNPPRPTQELPGGAELLERIFGQDSNGLSP